MKVIWSKTARDRLREIHDYIAQDSPTRGRQVADRLTRRSEKIALLPRIDRPVPEYQGGDLREVLERPYRIIYRVTPNQIEIVTLKHYRQRLPHDPRRLTPSVKP